MKKILFLLLLTVVFGACESDTDSNWNNRPGGNSDDTAKLGFVCDHR